MPSPFPGMDPYLEDPSIFPGFHHRLADEIADRLNARIVPKYYADVQVRTVLDEVSIALPKTMLPDVGIYEQPPPWRSEEFGPAIVIAPAPIERIATIPTETRLFGVHVRVTETGELVTAIEILSPYNKRGEGLDDYRLKRKRILSSNVHLVEIDLLRGGQRPGREVNEPALEADYISLVNRNRNHDTRISEIWPVAVAEPLPVLPIPLLSPDPDVALELNAAARDIYARARYDARINYHAPIPPPPLRPAMQQWVEQQRAAST